MPQIDDCQPELIGQFLSGEISSVALTELEQHLTRCQRCDDALTDQTADPHFWKDARTFLSSSAGVVTSPNSLHRDDLDHVLSTILNPTDDPHMLGRFGGYEISGVIGRGGMGIVMKGFDISLDRFVAIKLLDPCYASVSAARERFAREAQAAAAVVHDNVIAIYGVDHTSPFPFLVMPYVKGESLQQRIDRAAPLSLEDILGIGLQIARGLSAAHDQGLVHRDIKPANILMPASVSRVIITDFGLARAADDSSLTRSGVIAGTPQYMSPEQVTGERVDGRTDLFSLGSVLYAMACGHSPFRAETPYGVMRRITDHPHRPLSQVNSDTPVWLEQIIDRLLQKSPLERFGSAAEVADHLEDCLAHLRQPTTVMLPVIQPAPSLSRRKRSFVTMFLSISAVIIGLLWIGSRPDTRNGPPTTEARPTTSSELDWIADDSELVHLETNLLQLWKDVSREKFEGSFAK